MLATIEATDVAVITAVIVSLLAVVAATVAVMRLTQTLRQAREAVAELQTTSTLLLGELATLTERAGRDFERVDDLIGSAEALASTVDSAARVGYLAVGKPVIKTVAFAKGTSRAARRIRPPKVS